jgi:hypothetical protein
MVREEEEGTEKAQMKPLTERICKEMMVANILGPAGMHPICLGEVCSDYEVCQARIKEASAVLINQPQGPGYCVEWRR